MNGTRGIPLTQRKVALVDEDDFGWLNQWKWCASKHSDCDGGVVHWYARRTAWDNGDRVAVLMHRVILEAKKGEISDHRDRDGLNNRRANLRICTTAQNSLNRVGYPITKKTSNFKGVHWHVGAKKWVVQFRHHHVGLFEDEKEAAAGYDLAALAWSSEFARPNSSRASTESPRTS